MKKTKQNYQKAFRSLDKQLDPIIQSIETFEADRPTKANLQSLNSLMYQALAIYQNHINILEIIVNLPSGTGNKAIPENDAILLRALKELIGKDKKYPTETQWMSWIDNQKFKPIKKATRTRKDGGENTNAINGWGVPKLKQFLIENKKNLKVMTKYTLISEMAKFHKY
jgi:hypothetical protein